MTKVKVTIDIEFDQEPDKYELTHIEEQLRYHIGNGLLTGESDIEVEEYRISVDREENE